MIALTASSFANLVQFGDADLDKNVDWKTYGFTDNKSTINTASITQDGITFSLTVTTSDKLNLNADGDLWGVNGGHNSTRLDHDGTTGESALFTFAISGDTGKLTSLYFGGMSLTLFNNSYERISVSDGTTTLTVWGGKEATWIDYDTELKGLTPLLLDNVDTWQLNITALQSTDADPVANPTDLGFTQVDINYTVIPEPATLGLLSVVGLGILFVRRWFINIM